MTTIDFDAANFNDWFAALTGDLGSAQSGSSNVARKEGALMRRWLLAHHATSIAKDGGSGVPQTNTSERLEINWIKVRDRIREREAERARQVAAKATQEALDNKSHPQQSHKRDRRLSALASNHLAVGLVTGTILLAGIAYWKAQQQVSSGNEQSRRGDFGETVFRGANGVTSIATDKPDAVAADIIGLINTSKKKFRRVELVDASGNVTGAIEIQVHVDAGIDVGLESALRAKGINVPENGNVSVVVTPRMK